MSSLQITSVTAAIAHRVAAHYPAWPRTPGWTGPPATAWTRSPPSTSEPHAYVLAFALRFLDAVHDTHPEAAGLLDRLGAYLPATGRVHVEGGTEHEMLRPLDFAPTPDRPVRALFAPERRSRPTSTAWPGRSRTTAAGPSTTPRSRPRVSLDWRGYGP